MNDYERGFDDAARMDKAVFKAVDAENDLLRSLLSMHRCLSDGAMTVGECNLTRRCGCSCFGRFPPHQEATP